MKLTRRTLLAGAAALPAVVGLERLSAAKPLARNVFLFDAGLPDTRHRHAAALVEGHEPRELEGDRIRFAREVVSARPDRIQGFSRQADALLVEEVAAEAGYRREWLRTEGAAMEWLLVRR